MDSDRPPPRGFALALAGRRFLLCDACGRADEVTHADLLRHARDGWPRCCGEVMDYFMKAPDRTAPVRPRRRCPSCGRAGARTPAGCAAPTRLVCLVCALKRPAAESKA